MKHVKGVLGSEELGEVMRSVGGVQVAKAKPTLSNALM